MRRWGRRTWFRSFGNGGGAHLQPPATLDELAEFESRLGARLPDAHRRLLLLANGFETDHGYLRFFGVGRGAAIDMLNWNAPELWKFAYRGAADPYLCFGELGTGDQFAYRLEELAHHDNVRVYYLLANDMSVIHEYDSLGSFLASPILHGILSKAGDFLDWFRDSGI